ncbi:MAG: HD domain-containing protein [Myxococcota bacterium]
MLGDALRSPEHAERLPEDALRLPAGALELLCYLGAPDWLLHHHRVAVAAAMQLVSAIRLETGAQFDRRQVLMGAALHDCGKILHPEERGSLGEAHEAAGEQLLLAKGIRPEVARCCRTHRDWRSREAKLEDLLVALAVRLPWGPREETLEQRIIDAVAARSPTMSAWEVYVRIAPVFDSAASLRPARQAPHRSSLSRADAVGLTPSRDRGCTGRISEPPQASH